MKKVWEEYRAFLTTIVVVAAIAMVFFKIPVPQWLETLVSMGAGIFYGYRIASDKYKS